MDALKNWREALGLTALDLLPARVPGRDKRDPAGIGDFFPGPHFDTDFRADHSQREDAFPGGQHPCNIWYGITHSFNLQVFV